MPVHEPLTSPPITSEKDFYRTLHANQHEVYIVSFDEVEGLLDSLPARERAVVLDVWKQERRKLELSAGFYASGQDGLLLAKLVGALGGAGAQAYVRHYGGKPHIVLKGYAGRRALLTGTRYGVSHPKVVSLGLGRLAAQNAARSGGVLTIYLLTGYRVLDYFLSDQGTLTQLIGGLAADVVKVGVTVGAALGAEALLAAIPVMSVYAIGPLAVVFVVGLAVAVSLELLDQQFQFTPKLIRTLEELEAGASEELRDAKASVAATLGTLIRSQTRKLILTPR